MSSSYKVNLSDDLYINSLSPHGSNSLHCQKVAPPSLAYTRAAVAIEIEMLIETELKLLRDENERIRQLSSSLEEDKAELIAKNQELELKLYSEKKKNEQRKREGSGEHVDSLKEQISTFRKLCRLLEEEKEELKDKVSKLELKLSKERIRIEQVIIGNQSDKHSDRENKSRFKINAFDKRLLTQTQTPSVPVQYTSIRLPDRTHINESQAHPPPRKTKTQPTPLLQLQDTTNTHTCIQEDIQDKTITPPSPSSGGLMYSAVKLSCVRQEPLFSPLYPYTPIPPHGREQSMVGKNIRGVFISPSLAPAALRNTARKHVDWEVDSRKERLEHLREKLVTSKLTMVERAEVLFLEQGEHKSLQLEKSKQSKMEEIKRSVEATCVSPTTGMTMASHFKSRINLSTMEKKKQALFTGSVCNSAHQSPIIDQCSIYEARATPTIGNSSDLFKSLVHSPRRDGGSVSIQEDLSSQMSSSSSSSVRDGKERHVEQSKPFRRSRAFQSPPTTTTSPITSPTQQVTPVSNGRPATAVTSAAATAIAMTAAAAVTGGLGLGKGEERKGEERHSESRLERKERKAILTLLTPSSINSDSSGFSNWSRPTVTPTSDIGKLDKSRLSFSGAKTTPPTTRSSIFDNLRPLSAHKSASRHGNGNGKGHMTGSPCSERSRGYIIACRGKGASSGVQDENSSPVSFGGIVMGITGFSSPSNAWSFADKGVTSSNTCTSTFPSTFLSPTDYL